MYKDGFKKILKSIQNIKVKKLLLSGKPFPHIKVKG